jgi:hypothetical protein
LHDFDERASSYQRTVFSHAVETYGVAVMQRSSRNPPAGPRGSRSRRLAMTRRSRIRQRDGNARCNGEVEAKISQVATSTLEEYPTRQFEATAVALEEYPTRQIETTAVAPGEALQVLTIRRLGASRTVLGSVVNVNPPATSHSAARPESPGRAALGCVRAGNTP